MRDKALADFSKRPEDGQAIYEDTAHEVANQVAVRATQKAIRAGGVTECGDANNLNTRPITPILRPNGQPRAGGGGRGAKKASSGVTPSGKLCFRKAFEGCCGELKCLHLHNKAAMDDFQTRIGATSRTSARDGSALVALAVRLAHPQRLSNKHMQLLSRVRLRRT